MTFRISYCCLVLSLVTAILVCDDNNGNNHDNGVDTCVTYYLTAKEWFNKADSLAKVWSSDAQLILIAGAHIDTLGQANICDTFELFPSWTYRYNSLSVNKHKDLVARNRLILHYTGNLDERPAIPGPWLDSDSIMTVVRDYSGNDFLKTHPNATITMNLQYNPSLLDGIATWSVDMEEGQEYTILTLNAATAQVLTVLTGKR